MDTRRIAFDWLLKNQPETIAQLRQFLKASGISEKAYADAFVLLFNTQAPNEAKVTYIATTNQWQTGTRIMSDAKLFVSLSKVCEVIHDYVLNEWQESIFSAWIPPKEFARVENAMDHMESLSKLKAILELAAQDVTVEVSAASRVQWEDPNGDDDD